MKSNFGKGIIPFLLISIVALLALITHSGSLYQWSLPMMIGLMCFFVISRGKPLYRMWIYGGIIVVAFLTFTVILALLAKKYDFVGSIISFPLIAL